MPREKDEEMAALQKVMDELKKLQPTARRRVFDYVSARLDDDERVAKGLPPGE